MAMDMDQAMMARHHAEMYMYDTQLAQIFMNASQIYTAMAQSNYKMYQHHSGAAMQQPQMMPGMAQPQMIPSGTMQPSGSAMGANVNQSMYPLTQY